MESKTQNLVIKIVTGLSILFGVLFTIWVMGDDNPKEVSLEDQQKWANYKSENEIAYCLSLDDVPWKRLNKATSSKPIIIQRTIFLLKLFII